MNWYLAVLKKYAEFNGRARRQEFWMFFLFNLIFGFVAGIVDSILGTYLVVYTIYTLAVLIPFIAVGVRRLHDTGKSGWLYLIVLIPVIGAIALLVLFVIDSTPGENEYGKNPKELIAE
ncbi:DUF805 domain-containing protein [Ancylomarina sp. 16SWW S1-10-2]|uniref:DUF805 domain-containing protein n=1 Tax=Ancylomarina sp. 16SWW S1-10-2 TaxID=2499681 RepID=UPI0012ADF021|nr:DUF805 domain-containing protein [Ancylomarina sp. 16SWW S1-10-2]MRT94576.1 DUF805 domain-containing protein [Ancylomarina sp. 16SWW S1-10-2]